MTDYSLVPYEPKKVGSRGKYAESKFRDALQARARQDMHFVRLPDARAGSFQPTIADFLIVRRGLPIFVEVKEIDHEFRLPQKNLKEEQLARLRLWYLAGASCAVVIHFTPLRAQCKGLLADQLTWRMAPACEFKSGQPSWDTRDLPLMSLNQIVSRLCD